MYPFAAILDQDLYYLASRPHKKLTMYGMTHLFFYSVSGRHFIYSKVWDKIFIYFRWSHCIVTVSCVYGANQR